MTKYSFLTNKEVKLIASKYRAGKTIREIRKETGRSYFSIRFWLKRQGVVMRPRKIKFKKWTEERKEEVRKLICEGYSLETIAEQMGTTKEGVKYARRLLGLDTNKIQALIRLATYGRNPERKDKINRHGKAIPVGLQREIKRRARAGEPYRSIAKALNCGTSTVLRYAPHKWIAARTEKNAEEELWE